MKTRLGSVHSYDHGMEDLQLILIGEVLTIEGVDRHDIKGAHLYEGRAVPVGRPGDIVVVKQVPDDDDLQQYLDRMGETGLGATRFVGLRNPDAFNVMQVVSENEKLLTEVAQKITKDKAGILPYNYNSGYGQVLADKLSGHTDADVVYLGSTQRRSSQYNDKILFNKLVRQIPDVPAEPGAVLDRKAVDEEHLRSLWDEFNVNGRALVKPNKGASGVNMYKIEDDTIGDVLAQMRAAKDDVTQWRVCPKFPLKRSNSGLYRLADSVQRISPVSGQILHPSDSEVQPGMVHHGNYYPAGYRESGLSDSGSERVGDLLTSIGEKQHSQGARAFAAGVDFIQIATDVPRYDLDEGTIIPVENNYRLTGQDPAASLYSKLRTKHDMDELFLVLYNVYLQQRSLDELYAALGNTLYDGSEPEGTVVTNPFPLFELGKTTVVSVGPSPESVRTVVDETTTRLGDDDTFELVVEQVPWL